MFLTCYPVFLLKCSCMFCSYVCPYIGRENNCTEIESYFHNFLRIFMISIVHLGFVNNLCWMSYKLLKCIHVETVHRIGSEREKDRERVRSIFHSVWWCCNHLLPFLHTIRFWAFVRVPAMFQAEQVRELSVVTVWDAFSLEQWILLHLRGGTFTLTCNLLNYIKDTGANIASLSKRMPSGFFFLYCNSGFHHMTYLKRLKLHDMNGKFLCLALSFSENILFQFPITLYGFCPRSEN